MNKSEPAQNPDGSNIPGNDDVIILKVESFARTGLNLHKTGGERDAILLLTVANHVTFEKEWIATLGFATPPIMRTHTRRSLAELSNKTIVEVSFSSKVSRVYS